MTPATATPRGKRKAFAEAPPPRDVELLRHEIANVLQGAGKPMHQMEIQAKLRVNVPLWEILQALHQGTQHFGSAGIGAWELREAGRVLAAQPLPVTDEVRASKPASSRTRKSTPRAAAEGGETKPASPRSRKPPSRDESEGMESKPASSRSRKAPSRDGSEDTEAKPASSRSRTSPSRGAAEGAESKPAPSPSARTSSRGETAGGAAKPSPAGSRKNGARDEVKSDDLPWDVSPSTDAKRPAVPVRAASSRPVAPAPPRVETARPVARKPEVPWAALPLVVEALRSHGHPMTAHELKKSVLAAGGDTDFEGVLSLGNASSDLVRYPFGRGLYVGLSAWGSEGFEEVAETLWAQARVQMLGSELLDPDAVRAVQAVAQRKGDASLLEVARHFLVS